MTLTPSDPQPTLHPYQASSVRWLHRTPRAILMMEMGLGKTATVLSALTPDHLPALVLAPKRVAEHVWPAEQRKWRPDLTLSLAAGTPAQRARALETPAAITVLGWDNIGDLTGKPPNWRPPTSPPVPYRTIILDELSGYKDRSTRRWRSARRLTKNAHYVWGLTGTPTPNGLLDMWAQAFLVDGGAALGTSITAYRERYFSPGHTLPSGVVTEWHLRPGADAAIHRRLEQLAISLRAEDYLTLPPVTYNDILTPLPSAARTAYRNMKQTLVADLSLIGGGIHTAANAAVLSNKLRQITAGFLYEDGADLHPDSPYRTLHREKLLALDEILANTTTPVLLFYGFQSEKREILARYPAARHIDSPGVLEDWNAGKIPLLIAHPASAGHGLNLQHGGHTVVWTTLDWSLELWQQANARINRQGQQHPVLVHSLVAPGTVDRTVQSVLRGKDTAQSALMSHLESPL